jgi:transposase
MVHHDNATRALVVALRASGKTTNEVISLTGISKQTINATYAQAIEQGFNPHERPLKLKDKHIEDSPQSGRLLKQDKATEKVLNLVRSNCYGRERACANLAGALSQEGFDILAATVWRVLRKAGFRKTKLTRKPRLTKQMKKDCLNWCL